MGRPAWPGAGAGAKGGALSRPCTGAELRGRVQSSQLTLGKVLRNFSGISTTFDAW